MLCAWCVLLLIKIPFGYALKWAAFRYVDALSLLLVTRITHTCTCRRYSEGYNMSHGGKAFARSAAAAASLTVNASIRASGQIPTATAAAAAARRGVAVVSAEGPTAAQQNHTSVTPPSTGAWGPPSMDSSNQTTPSGSASVSASGTATTSLGHRKQE